MSDKKAPPRRGAEVEGVQVVTTTIEPPLEPITPEGFAKLAELARRPEPPPAPPRPTFAGWHQHAAAVDLGRHTAAEPLSLELPPWREQLIQEAREAARHVPWLHVAGVFVGLSGGVLWLYWAAQRVVVDPICAGAIAVVTVMLVLSLDTFGLKSNDPKSWPGEGPQQ